MTLEDVLKKNAPLRNVHAGKRCFLVGTGPSLGLQDISPLQGEITIVASSFFRHPQAKMVNPAYWVLADPYFWERGSEYLTPTFGHALETAVAPKLFVPSRGFSHFAGFNRGPLIDLHFFHYDHGRDHSMPIDFSTGIPPFGQNVMIVCLMLAFHLGCSPIYFIGCDHDFFGITEDAYNSSTITHFYPQQKASGHIERLSWQEWKHSMELMDDQYRCLRDYAAKNGFSVFNATRGGCLETFPRVEYEALFTGAPAALPEETANPFRLCQAAIARIDAGDHHTALILLDEAIRKNVNRHPRVEGLEFLKALCLATLGRPRDALLFARQDFDCNPSNRSNVVGLIRQLESALR